MTKPMRRIAAIVATATMSITLSACTQGHWVYSAPPAAGVQADEGGVKLRSFLIIADTEGNGMLVGAIATRDTPVEVTGIKVTPQVEGGTFGDPQTIKFTESIRKGATSYLDGATTQFTSRDLTQGLLVKVEVSFADGSTVQVEAPVVSSTHPDYQDWWAKNRT